jgi:hypothetical protein
MTLATAIPHFRQKSLTTSQVTKDPEALNNPKNENPGIVTSDSLAADSIQEGGSFAANSDARGPHPQPSHSTNTNTTDTSNATRLDAAPDAEARQASEEWSENAQLNAGNALSGKGPTYNTATGSGDGAPTATAGNTAPQPKGKNIQEGGFDSDAPNASYTTDIGGKDDPGRVALQRADVPVAGGAGPRESEISGDGQFDSLKDASA